MTITSIDALIYTARRRARVLREYENEPDRERASLVANVANIKHQVRELATDLREAGALTLELARELGVEP